MDKVLKGIKFEKVDEDTYSFLNTQYNLKEKADERGYVNMCRAYDELINDKVTDAVRVKTKEVAEEVTKQVTEQVTKQVTKQVKKNTDERLACKRTCYGNGRIQ